MADKSINITRQQQQKFRNAVADYHWKSGNNVQFIEIGTNIELAPSSSPTPSVTPSFTMTPTVTQTPSTTISITPTRTPSNTITPTVTMTPTSTATPSNTVTPSNTATPSLTQTPSNTPSITATPSVTQTPSNTATPNYTPSNSATPSNNVTPSNTLTPTETPSSTATPSITSTPSNTASPSYTPSNTTTPSNSMTPSVTVTQTPTMTPTVSPFVPIPGDPTLQIWYDGADSTQFQPTNPSSGSAITQWTDKSATAHNAAPTGGPGTRPLFATNVQNGKSAVYFDQIEDGLEAPISQLASLTASSVIWVGKTFNTSSNQQVLQAVEKSGGSYTSLNEAQLYISGSNNFVIGFASASAVSNVPVDTGWHIHTILFDGTQSGNTNRLKYRVDGVERQLTYTGNVSSSTSPLTNGMLFGTDANLNNDFLGYMGEVLVYTKTLSGSQLTDTENYLFTKWNTIPASPSPSPTPSFSITPTITTSATPTIPVNTFNITNNGSGNYIINGSSNPTLSITEGETYTFNINASGHPFWIKTVNSTGTGNAYNDGVTNNGTDNGTITFVVPYDAPSTLYYNCQFHASMAGTINVIDVPTPTPTPTP